MNRSSYSYDANGNRTGGSYGVTTGNEMSADASWTYTYDASGNLTEKDTTGGGSSEHWTYAYDPKGELTEVKHYNSAGTLDLTVDYLYDALGNRTEVDVTQGSTTVTRYAYDMSNPAKAGALGTSGSDIWAVLNDSSSLTSRQLQGDGIDQHLAWVTAGGNQYWYLTDHLGSTRDTVDTNGTLQDSVAYDAYGNIIGTELAPSSRGLYAWTGRELDAETGLQYNRARYYDASTGRWISQDPMGFDAGDSDLYRYVKNEPTDILDPGGLKGPELQMWYDPLASVGNIGKPGKNDSIEKNLGFENQKGSPKVVGFHAEWYIDWTLNTPEDGVIFQHVHRHREAWNAAGNHISIPDIDYYEAWPVKADVSITTGKKVAWLDKRALDPKARPDIDDLFDDWKTAKYGNSVRGWSIVTGSARFIAGASIPVGWRPGGAGGGRAGALPASSIPPRGWSDAGGVQRVLVATWGINNIPGGMRATSRVGNCDAKNYEP